MQLTQSSPSEAEARIEAKSSSCVNCIFLFDSALAQGWRLRPSSQAVYRSMFRKVDSVLGEGFPAQPAGPDDTLSLIERAYPGSFNTQAKLWGALRLLFTHQREIDAARWLAELDRLGTRYYKKKAVLRTPPKDPAALTEAAALQTKPGGWKHLRNAALVGVLQDCGVKPAEARSLKLRDLHLSAGSVTVAAGGRRRRSLVAGLTCSQLLRDFVAQHPAAGRADAVLFCADERGERMLDSSTVHRILHRVAERGLSREFAADTGSLRAAKAREMLAAGHTVREIQAVLGHAQLESTLELLSRLQAVD